VLIWVKATADPVASLSVSDKGTSGMLPAFLPFPPFYRQVFATFLNRFYAMKYNAF
jgi:hypothetical protein